MKTCYRCKREISPFDDYIAYQLHNKIACFPICKHDANRNIVPTLYYAENTETDERCMTCSNEDWPCYFCVLKQWNKLSPEQKNAWIDKTHPKRIEAAKKTIYNCSMKSDKQYLTETYEIYEKKFHSLVDKLSTWLNLNA